MKRILRRKGIGLTEAIVAMAIIVIVSVSAMGIITRFATNTAGFLKQNAAINIVDNALECFKYCDSQAEFYKHVFITMGLDDWPAAEGNYYTYTGIPEYTVVVKVAYNYSPHMAMFSATVKKTTGRTIYSIVNYVKYQP